MARKRGKLKMMNTHRYLYYNLNHSGTDEDAHYIDLARDLSAMNRRLYRQGRNYSISNISVHDSQGDARVLVSTAPNTWATHAAWELAFDGWKRQRAQLLSESGSNMKTPRWSDFKVYLNKEHVVDGDWPTVRDDEENVVKGTGANADAEWDYADISFVKAGTRYDDHAIGLMGTHSIGSSITDETTPDDTSYDGYISCLEGLQEIRTQPPVAADDGNVVNAVFAGLNLANPGAVTDVLTEIADENDIPPYSLEFVGSDSNPDGDTGAFPVRECHISSTYSPMAMMGPIPNVPCGLLQIETKSGTDGNTIGLLIELTPGSYKGVHAPPMGN